MAVLENARVICCTLNMTGSSKFKNLQSKIEYLIIDEACQSIELETLIALNLNPERVILVGDEKQLPATVLSVNNKQTKYSRSLFERLVESGFQKSILYVQYRMHP